MLLVGYCFGIRSERRLCEEVHLNLAYRWFCLASAWTARSLTIRPSPRTATAASMHQRPVAPTVRDHRAPVHGRRTGGGREGTAVDASLIKADANRQSGTDGAKGLDTEITNRAIEEYLAVLDDAAFGERRRSCPSISPSADPASRWTGAAAGGMAFYAYSTNYLIDLKYAVIVEVEASTAIRQDRSHRLQDHDRARQGALRPPSRYVKAADTAYGSAEMLNWLVNDQRIEPQRCRIFDKSWSLDRFLAR